MLKQNMMYFDSVFNTMILAIFSLLDLCSHLEQITRCKIEDICGISNVW